MADLRGWYQEQTAGLHADDEAARRARLALLATEEAFFVRFLGLLPISNSEWDEILTDIGSLRAKSRLVAHEKVWFKQRKRRLLTTQLGRWASTQHVRFGGGNRAGCMAKMGAMRT